MSALIIFSDIFLSAHCFTSDCRRSPKRAEFCCIRNFNKECCLLATTYHSEFYNNRPSANPYYPSYVPEVVGPAITSAYSGAVPAYTGGIGAIPPYGGGVGGIGVGAIPPYGGGLGGIPPFQTGIPAVPSYGTGLGGIPAYNGGLGGIGGIGAIPPYTAGIPAYGGLGGSYPIGGIPSTGYGFGEIY
jgi:hypothetical protein